MNIEEAALKLIPGLEASLLEEGLSKGIFNNQISIQLPEVTFPIVISFSWEGEESSENENLEQITFTFSCESPLTWEEAWIPKLKKFRSYSFSLVQGSPDFKKLYASEFLRFDHSKDLAQQMREQIKSLSSDIKRFCEDALLFWRNNLHSSTECKLSLKYWQENYIDLDPFHKDIEQKRESIKIFYLLKEEPFWTIFLKLIQGERTGLGILELLLSDPQFYSLQINAMGDVFGYSFPKTEFEYRLENELHKRIIKNLAEMIGYNESSTTDEITGILREKFHVSIIFSYDTKNQPLVFITGGMGKILSMNEMISLEAFDQNVSDFLNLAYLSGVNILLGGNCSTPYLFHALVNSCTTMKRVIILGNSRRKFYSFAPNIIQIPAKSDSPRALALQLESILKHDPETILIEDVSGPEAWSLLRKSMSGPVQFLASIAGETMNECVDRLITFALTAETNFTRAPLMNLLPTAFPLLIQFNRLSTGKRKIVQISELILSEKRELIIKHIFKYSENQNILIFKNHIPQFIKDRQKLGLSIPAIFKSAGGH